MATAPVFVGTPKVGVAVLANTDTTAIKTVITAGASGSKVVSLTAVSNDTAARNLAIHITRSATNYCIATTNIPIAAGSDGTVAAVNLLNSTILPGLPVDNDGQRYLFLQSGDVLAVAALVQLTNAKNIWVTGVFGDF